MFGSYNYIINPIHRPFAHLPHFRYSSSPSRNPWRIPRCCRFLGESWCSQIKWRSFRRKTVRIALQIEAGSGEMVITAIRNSADHSFISPAGKQRWLKRLWAHPYLQARTTIPGSVGFRQCDYQHQRNMNSKSPTRLGVNLQHKASSSWKFN